MLLESTRSQLARYQPTDARERHFHARLLDLLESPAAFSRDQYQPGHLTASAFVLSAAGEQLLLIFHRKLGIWIQPGGHVEPTDTSLAAAARRELAEEVGVSLPAAEPDAIFDLDVHAIPARKNEPAHEHFDVRFCFRAPTAELSINAEVVDARWVELAKIEQMTSDESVLRAARKLHDCVRSESRR